MEALYDALDMTYAASLGRIRKRAQLDKRLHARLERSTGDVADVAPGEQLQAELCLGISAYTGRSRRCGAARRLTGRGRRISDRRIVIGL